MPGEKITTVYALNPQQAKGLWGKWSGMEHPHAACVAWTAGKGLGDGHAFCAEVEKLAAGTTPAERAAEKKKMSERQLDYSLRLDGVEIFATGTHNGDDYTEADLDAMIEAFGKLDFRPPLKSGHSKDQAPGMPSLGWISNLRRQGEKLIADFVDMPQIVYDYIKDKRFNTVSAEIYWNLRRGATTFSRALKAVALLGAEIPAVAGLRPLHELFAEDEAAIHYTEKAGVEFNHTEVNMTADEIKAFEDRVKAAEEAAKAEKTAREALEQKVKELSEAQKKAGDPDFMKMIGSITDSEAKQNAIKAEAAKREAELKLLDSDNARKAAEEEAKAYKERSLKLEDDARKANVAAVAKTCRIPAMRVFAAQFLDLATRVTETKVYADDDNKQQIPAMEACERFIKYVNENASRIFHDVKNNDFGQKREGGEGAAGQEIDRLTRKHMLDHNVKDYSAAMHAVLDANPSLRHEYSQEIANH